MKNFRVYFGIALTFLTISCSSQKPINTKDNFNREYQTGAYLWVQTAAEYRALCYQAYNLAKLKLDRDLENKHNKKRAIIMDLDETVLDNSFGGAQEIKERKNWSSDSLKKWVAKRAAGEVPGAREFIEYAVSRQVEVFYVSNRHITQIDDTYANLIDLKIPVKKENLHFLDQERSKENRRQNILKKFHVVLYFGDNLIDFHRDWEEKTSSERRALVDKHKDEFGEKYIVLPNPLYGDWEESLPKVQNKAELLKTER